MGLTDLILYRNCRGACNNNLLSNIRSVSLHYRPLIIVLAETKCDQELRLVSLKKLGYDGFSFVPRVGRSGGLVAVWKSEFIAISELRKERQFLHFHCQIKGYVPFFLTSVYVVPQASLKQVLWADLKLLSSLSIFDPWVLVGDFNDISLSSEKSGGSSSDDCRIKLFHDRLQDCRLSDIGFCGPKFTWKGPKLQRGTPSYPFL
ncbi:hypothetical protein K1719_043430 [Acacia pycnantha]|nr:hypothetical protein K1719_043430 [Acacia pycnantha]